LEQVFALLKRADLVVSAKGSQGGYQLFKRAEKISVYDILYATESALFEETTIEGYDELRIENTLRKAVFDKLDENIEKLLEGIKLQDLLAELEKETSQEGYAYQI
jgi:Rrf2 family protein